ncbi:hypothetical protein XENOCAPTIV_013125, partial [Xenoophorus captivus]
RWKAAPPDFNQRSASFCRSVSLPFANELHIQPVVSPQQNLSCPDNLLAEHFSLSQTVDLLSSIILPHLQHSVVVAATVCRARDLSAGVMGAFVHQVEMENPTEEQRLSMLVSLSGELHLGRDGLVLGDLSTLLTEAGRAACRRLIHTCCALETLQDAQSKAIGAPKVTHRLSEQSCFHICEET